jgi:hypothetical protein
LVSDIPLTSGNRQHDAVSSDFYPESRFGGFTRFDGTINFNTRVNALLNTSSIVLDVGCGREIYIQGPFPLRRDLRTLMRLPDLNARNIKFRKTGDQG